MSADPESKHTSDYEKTNLDLNKDSDVNDQNASISKDQIPSFSKILIADDGKEESDKVLNYAISLSRYSGGDLLILRILENIDKMEDVSVEGSVEDKTGNKDMKREVKGEILDEMEKKIKRCKEAGCESNISYKFRVGNAIDEIVSEVEEGNYDLIILRSSHIDSWMRSLFSDARRIMSNIKIPALIVQ